MFLISNTTELSCGEILQIVETGALGEFNPCDDFVVLVSCCFCGGGRDSAGVDGVLKSWKLLVYGHEPTGNIILPDFKGGIIKLPDFSGGILKDAEVDVGDRVP